MSIPTSAMTAARAVLRRIGRINILDVDSLLPRLVFDELLQFTKRPRMSDHTLFLAGLYPLSHVSQLLHDHGIALLQRVDDSTADQVVQVRHPAILSARQPSQNALSAPRAFTLQGLPLGSEPATHVHRLSAGKLHAVTRGSEVGDPEINADHFSLLTCRIGRRGRRLEHNVDGELPLAAVVVERGRGRLLPGKKVSLVVSNCQSELLPPLNSACADPELTATVLDEPKEVFVQIERGRLEQSGLSSLPLRRFDSAADPSQRADHVIRGQAIAFLERIVATFVERDRVADIVLKGLVKRVVAAFGVLRKGLVESFAVVRGDFKFTFDGLNEAHDQILPSPEVAFKPNGLRPIPLVP